LLTGLGCQKKTSARHQSLTIAGSTSVQPFAEKLAEIYMEFNAQITINVQGGGSTAGIKACREGAADIGTSSRDLHPEEEDLKKIVIAWDGIAVIVHPSNPISNLSLEQIRHIFSGKIRSWAQVGGGERRIYFVTREEGSGTRDAFEHLVMKKTEISDEALVEDSNGSVREIIAHNPQAIGYISYGVVNHQVKALAIDGVSPSLGTIKNRIYRLTRPFLFVTRRTVNPQTRKFIDFVLAKEGQEILEKEGLVGVR
jgi:phosphate transport system substrate-binding protein